MAKLIWSRLDHAPNNLDGFHVFLRRELPEAVHQRVVDELDRQFSGFEDRMKKNILQFAMAAAMGLLDDYRSLRHPLGPSTPPSSRGSPAPPDLRADSDGGRSPRSTRLPTPDLDPLPFVPTPPHVAGTELLEQIIRIEAGQTAFDFNLATFEAINDPVFMEHYPLLAQDQAPIPGSHARPIGQPWEGSWVGRS